MIFQILVWIGKYLRYNVIRNFLFNGGLTMYQVSSNTKCCMTCDYWQGKRTPNITIVTTDNYLTPGKCYLIFSQGSVRIPMSSCSSWTKWSVLK